MQNQQNKGFNGKTPVNGVRVLFLLLLILMPLYMAKASIFTYIGDVFSSNKVQAEDLPIDQADLNSQNMDVLEANLSPLLSTDVSGVIKTKDDIALLAEGDPTAVGSDENTDSNAEDVSFYVVNKGDTLAEIAKMYDVSPDTIVWANHLTKGQALTEGSMLIIYPVDAISYKIVKGDTLASIAKKYKVDGNQIDDFNGLEGKLVIGDEILIPGAKPVNTEPKVKPKIKKSNLPSNVAVDVKPTGNGHFIPPVVCPITQGLHDRYGYDIGCPKGTPIRASASGTVIFSQNGYNGGFGWLTIIKDDSGITAYYAHQSARNVSVGDHVTQGQVIGKVGSTGRSTGPHLHFEVRGATNPYKIIGARKGQIIRSF